MSSSGAGSSSSKQEKRGRGRPPTYVWTGDETLSESQEKLKLSIERRRERQKATYHRRKKMQQEKKQREEEEADRAQLLDQALQENEGDSSKKPKEEDYQDEDYGDGGGNALVIVRDYSSPWYGAPESPRPQAAMIWGQLFADKPDSILSYSQLYTLWSRAVQWLSRSLCEIMQ